MLKKGESIAIHLFALQERDQGSGEELRQVPLLRIQGALEKEVFPGEGSVERLKGHFDIPPTTMVSDIFLTLSNSTLFLTSSRITSLDFAAPTFPSRKWDTFPCSTSRTTSQTSPIQWPEFDIIFLP